MSKRTIIHQKFDKDKVTIEEIAKFHKTIKEALPENCVLITAPTDITKLDGDDILIVIDAKPYTTNELLEIIGKAWQYDELG